MGFPVVGRGSDETDGNSGGLGVSPTVTEKCHSRGACFQKEKKVKESKRSNVRNGKWLEKYRLVFPETVTKLCKWGTYRNFFNIDKSDRRVKNNMNKWKKYVRSKKLGQNKRDICK